MGGALSLPPYVLARLLLAAFLLVALFLTTFWAQ